MTELVPLVAVDALPDDLRAQWDATARGGLRDFITVSYTHLTLPTICSV